MSFSEEQHEVMDRLGKATREVIPRFFKTMPKAYFQSHDREARIAHLKAIVAAEAAGIDQELTIRSQDGRRFTVISRRSFPGQLSDMIARLPLDQLLTSARVHTASDGSLVLDIFEFAPTSQDELGEQFPTNSLGVQIQSGALEFELRSQNARSFFQRVARFVARRGFDIQNAELSHSPAGRCRLQLFVEPLPQDPSLLAELERVYYLDDKVLEVAEAHSLTLQQAELMLALSRLAHTCGSEQTRDHLLEPFLSKKETALTVVDNLAQGQASESDHPLAEVCQRVLSSNLDQPHRQSLCLELEDCYYLLGREFDAAFPKGTDCQPQVVRTQGWAQLELEWLSFFGRAHHGVLLLAPNADAGSALAAFEAR